MDSILGGQFAALESAVSKDDSAANRQAVPQIGTTTFDDGSSSRREDTIQNNHKQKVRCPLCVEEKIFSHSDALTRHMRVIHPEIDVPIKKTTTPMTARRDEATVPPGPRHKCPYCDTPFTRRHNLRSHLLTHLPKKRRTQDQWDQRDWPGQPPFKCTLCPKSFTRNSNLKAHFNSHKLEPVKFPCSSCSKTFQRTSDRNRHERLQHGQHKYICGNLDEHGGIGCKKAFARRDALKEHRRTRKCQALQAMDHQRRYVADPVTSLDMLAAVAADHDEEIAKDISLKIIRHTRPEEAKAFWDPSLKVDLPNLHALRAPSATPPTVRHSLPQQPRFSSSNDYFLYDKQGTEPSSVEPAKQRILPLPKSDHMLQHSTPVSTQLPSVDFQDHPNYIYYNMALGIDHVGKPIAATNQVREDIVRAMYPGSASFAYPSTNTQERSSLRNRPSGSAMAPEALPPRTISPKEAILDYNERAEDDWTLW
jgi:hypothetical protein